MELKQSDTPREVAPSDLQLGTPGGFNARFEAYMRLCRTQSDAYNLTEDDHVELFGQPMYASYDSFRNCRNRKLKAPR